MPSIAGEPRSAIGPATPSDLWLWPIHPRDLWLWPIHRRDLYGSGPAKPGDLWPHPMICGSGQRGLQIVGHTLAQDHKIVGHTSAGHKSLAILSTQFVALGQPANDLHTWKVRVDYGNNSSLA